MNKKVIVYSLLISSLFITSSCSDDYLDTTPQSTINDEQLQTSPAGLRGYLNGIYTNLRTFGNTNSGNHEDYGHKSILAGLDMMSNDNVMTKSSWYSSWYNYTGRVQTNSRTLIPWNTYYLQIRPANTIIKNILTVGVTDENKDILGQAYALRAYFYFMLARIYGPTYIGHSNDLCVPLYTDPAIVEGGKARATVGEVYAQIEDDLLKSVNLLNGFAGNRENVGISVAQAFLAQVYLEMGKYPQAAQFANAAKNGYQLGAETDWSNGFYDITKTTDTMWGAVITGENTSFVASFHGHFDNTNTSGYAGGLAVYKSIDKRLYDKISETDYRKKAFVSPGGNPNYPALPAYANLKFIDPTVTDADYIYLRASEMYYIEAEALARSGNESQARTVLYQITHARDNAYILSANSGPTLIDEILTQKRIEMWGEGCAWFDMKRLGIGLNRIYTGTNHPTFGQLDIPANSSRFTWQIPQQEIDTNPSIVQNPN